MNDNFKLEGKLVRLRPLEEKDIKNLIYYMTDDKEWQQWDAPWENEDGEIFDQIEFENRLKNQINHLRYKEITSGTFIYRTLIIERLSDGEFLGKINSYHIDENYNYSSTGKHFTIGIGIYKKDYRNSGYGSEAWSLYIDYLMSKGLEEVYTQTWSGNIPAQKLIQKLGFILVDVDKNCHQLNGKNVDGYTYRLLLNVSFIYR